MASDHDLNSLSRFRKQSGRLVLEEHSHCEIPAGCGGVVLRWRNPFAAVPLRLHLYAPVPAACFLDGAEVQNGRVDLALGRHAVALALEDTDLSGGLILFAAVHPETRSERNPPALVTDAPLRVLTADDGTWKCTLQRPETDEWKTPTFDDRDWVVLTGAPKPRLASGARAPTSATSVSAWGPSASDYRHRLPRRNGARCGSCWGCGEARRRPR